MSVEFAEAIVASKLLGESSWAPGLRPVWDRAEPCVHDVAHMVVFDYPIVKPENLSRTVNNACGDLKRGRDQNERLTLATEMLFLRRNGAFIDEAAWLKTIVLTLPRITDSSVYRVTERPEVARFSRLLERRLRYHCEHNKEPTLP